MAETIIKIEGLTKTFGIGDSAVTALDDINLEIYKGEIFGIIGLSGAGKSTLVRCMNLLERPTEGRVIVDGMDLTSLPEKDLRKARQSIGMIFQSFNLLMQRTALENVCFPLELAGMSRKAARERAKELLRIVGLEEKANNYPAQLSGGQQQRVAIARALATNPKVLLCDEATSALDPTTTLSILELLKNLNRDLGVTVVVITHEMRVVEQICNRVVVIDHSRIQEIGTIEEVFRNPKTEAARKLVYPQTEHTVKFSGKGKFLRLAFNGNTTDRPIIAEMVLRCGAPVNIAFADTKVIEGKMVGHMILQLPEEPEIVQKMLDYLDSQNVIYSEEGRK